MVFDQASATMARGEIMLHEREGLPIPLGAAIDTNGEPTTDATAGLAGAQLTFGGAKGSAIALMVELLAGGLTGSPFAFEAADAHAPDYQGPTLNGELIMAINPALLGATPEAVTERCEEMFGHVLSEEGTRLPGDRRRRLRGETATGGVEIPTALYTDICTLSGEGDAGGYEGDAARGSKL